MVSRIEFRIGVLCLVGAAVVKMATAAVAGGFAVREQSTSAQGASFAGSAAGFDLSSMYWNPAAVTRRNGVNSESHAALILGQSDLTATAGALNDPAQGDATSGNIGDPAVAPASYVNYQLGQFYVGLSTNSPFGLTTKPERNWRGKALGQTSELLTINAAPTVGYKIMPGISVAAGAQIQYIDARLTSIVPGPGSLKVEGDDWGFGFTAGILIEPSEATTIGLGFRSSIAHTLKGDQTSNLGSSRIAAKADLPELVTLSVRQRLTDQWTVLGTVEWTNWSRVKSIVIRCTTAGGACVAAGSPLNSLDLDYDDGWFFAAGAEYVYAPDLLLRAGLAYEISPARSDASRTVRIADNDRVWASIGATYQWSGSTALDLAYTHIFVKDGGIDAGARLQADVESSVDIISASLKIKW